MESFQESVENTKLTATLNSNVIIPEKTVLEKTNKNCKNKEISDFEKNGSESYNSDTTVNTNELKCESDKNIVESEFSNKNNEPNNTNEKNSQSEITKSTSSNMDSQKVLDSVENDKLDKADDALALSKVKVEISEEAGKDKALKANVDIIKMEEVEEDFKGFPVIVDDLKNQELVKDLSKKEENELLEMEVIINQKHEFSSSPSSKRKRHDLEESDISSQCSSPALSVTSQLSVLSFTKRSRTGSPASKGSRKSTVDLTNPKYLLPFEYGWKREVVTRGITSREDGISKDIYYFHPSGKKLRSLREVSEKLTPGLTIENFTFCKEPLGADPQFETIRNAKSRAFSPFQPTPTKLLTSSAIKTRSEKPISDDTSLKDLSSTELLPVKDSPKSAPLKNFVKTPKESPATKTANKREKLVLKFNKGTPKIALKKSTPTINGERKSPKMMLPKLDGPKPHPNAPSGPRRKITPRKKPFKPNNNGDENKGASKAEGGDMEMGMLPPLWSPTAGSYKSSSNESLSWSHLDEEKSVNEEERMDPCTIRCTKAMGLIPTLQCSVCLCLYHPECCDMAPTTSYRQLLKYVCKNCQTKANETKSRNLVKHITPAVVTDKNPPIVSPKPIHPGLAPSPNNLGSTAPSMNRMPPLHRTKVPAPKSVFGGNSSPWLPPSNSMFRSPAIPKNYQTKVEDPLTPPQAIVNINNKRYIVVPKSNVLSVASGQNQSPSKLEPLQNTTIITPTPTSTIIQGPPLQNNPFIQPSATSPGVILLPFMPEENGSTDATTPQYLVVNPSLGLSATASSGQADLPIESETADQCSKRLEKTKKRAYEDGGNESMQKFMRNICIGYSALLNVFQYLKVQELLRAGRVCRLWRDLASHSSLWRTVRMKNSQVSDWKGFTDSLSRHGTKHLDLRKMLMSLDDAEEMWTMFAKHISNVQCLERLDMCRCSADVIAQIMEACPQLLVFNAQMIGVKDQTQKQKLSLESLSKMKKLKELRLKSFFGLHLLGSLKSLVDLSDTLTTLSLTSVKNVGSCEIQYIGKLQNLEALELGECSDLPDTFPHEVIAKLNTLKRIRLERAMSTNEILYQISKLKELKQLELINFDVGPGFDKALASCTNIKRLLLIPTYVTQSATTNNIILSGTFKLWKTLVHFVWVITMELLKVTELFVDQCEGKGSKKSGGNSVPVLKPVPLPDVKISQKDSENLKKEENETGTKNLTPITVIPIDELFDMLTEALPTTKVKLLKIPFQNTWRQSITDGGSI